MSETKARKSVFESLAKMLPRVGWFKEMKEDRFCQIAHEHFRWGRLTRSEYWDLMDRLRPCISGYVADKSYLKSKIDRRSLGEFALWINDQTDREGFFMEKWSSMALDIGLFTDIQSYEHGCDHRGRLLLFPAKQSKAADYKVAVKGGNLMPDGIHLIEVKYDPSLRKFTLKVADIESYLEQGCYILCILTDDCMVGPNGNKDSDIPFVLPEGRTYWCLISPDALAKIYEERCVSDRREMGDKKSIQLHPEDFGRYFLIEEWGKCRQRDGLARPWEDSSR